MKKVLFLVFLLPFVAFAQIQYPVTKTVDQKDDYFGTQVADPYRWLEDDKSEETSAWVKTQNQITFAYLEKISFRDALKKRLEDVSNYPKYTSPFKRGNYYYFYKNEGQQNQSVLYRQKDLQSAPEQVLDPNILSADGTTRLLKFVVSKDGKYAAYSLSKAGSDWEDIYELDLQTLKQLNDHLEWIKLSNISWQGDGFYYSRYPAPEKGKELIAKNENHQVYYHTTGTSQDQDKLIFEDKAHPLRFNEATTSPDEKYLFLSVKDKGEGHNGNALYYKNQDSKDFKDIESHFTNGTNSYIFNYGKDVYMLTGKGNRNLKVIKYDLETDNISTVIDESDPIQFVRCAGGKLFVTYMVDAHDIVKVFDRNGNFENEIKMSDIGTVGGFNGSLEDKDIFYTFTSFTYPTTIFSYNIESKKSTVFRKPELKFDPDDFVTEQFFYTSKDGTKVPMYLVYKKSVKKTGANPTLLYGYGGFYTTVSPSFSSYLIPFMEAGGIYASANIRGGGEYGEHWHKEGSKLNKQNTFDDFVYAAKYLIKKKYTDSEHLAIKGASNGGILIGAVCNQHPELFKVAIAQVGVMDMLRFQKFTIGWNWKAEYGTSENEEDFKVLYKYSPLHNIRAGLPYPAILVTTSDHDDRVVPAHSYKYIATLQTQAGKNCKNPLLIRVETNSGHGASSVRKSIELTTDIYSFIFYNMGFTPHL